MAEFKASGSFRALHRRPSVVLAASLALLSGATAAHATLGQRLDSVQADRVHMAAKMASVAASGWTVHTLTLGGASVVREFTGTDGMVFAVAWRGQGRPDLRQLLGDNFATLQADNVREAGPRTRRPLAVRRDDLVVHSGGHPGAFWGFAYLPQQTPAGFTPKDMR